MDGFICPSCGELYNIGELELYEVYKKDGQETEFICAVCGKEMLITSVVTDWNFETEVLESD